MAWTQPRRPADITQVPDGLHFAEWHRTNCSRKKESSWNPVCRGSAARARLGGIQVMRDRAELSVPGTSVWEGPDHYPEQTCREVYAAETGMPETEGLNMAALRPEWRGL